jgi:hypothetical protein
MFSPLAGSGRATLTSPLSAWRRRSVCRSTAIRALAILHEWVKATGAEVNETRLRMTRIPNCAETHP